MPPRAKKKTPAKKPVGPRGKKADALKSPSPPVQPEPEKSILEETEAVTEPTPASEGKEVEVEAAKESEESVAVREEEVSVTMTTTTTITTVVVEEEAKVNEENIEENNGSENNGSISVEEVVTEEKKLEIEGSVNIQETEENVGEKKLEIEGSVSVDEAGEGSSGAKDVEMVDGDGDGDGDAGKAEEEAAEINESDKREDDVQDVADADKSTMEDAVGGGDADEKLGDKEGEENESGSDDGDDEDDVELSSYMQQAPLKDRKRQSAVEIFVGGLHRQAVEEDLIKVFEKYGEVKAVRIVKNLSTDKSKGYAFISYATPEEAKKVLTELKDGVEVKGKRAGVSPSQDSDTLYMGGICKSWTKEQILEMLKGLGIEEIEEIYVPDDPKLEGKIRGFAYLEFNTHSDAMTAFQRLRKPDAIFGRNRSAKVAFAPSIHPSEEAMLQVKTVYVEGLTESWDEEKLKQLCEQYGQVEKIQLSCNLVKVKRKDFAFVTFASRENALACVEGINNAQIGEGDIKVKANLAKPQYKGRVGKTARGGYKVQKDGEKVGKADKSKAEGTKGKGKAPFSNAGRRSATAAPRGREHTSNGKRSTNPGPSGRPYKRPRGNEHGGPVVGAYGHQGNYYRGPIGNGRQPIAYDTAPAAYATPYGRGYGASAPNYPGYQSMEHHAGYLRPGVTSQGRDLYDYGSRRAGGYATQGSRASYAGGSALPPTYDAGYAGYAPYEGGNAGGYVPPTRGAYVPRRSYY